MQKNKGLTHLTGIGHPMNIHPTFHLDPHDELRITLRGEGQADDRDYLVGKVVTHGKHVNAYWPGHSKAVHLANQIFYLNEKEGKTLQKRMISVLPFSNQTKSILSDMFNRLFNKNEISEEELAAILDTAQNLDQLIKKATELGEDPNAPLAEEDVQAIFRFEEQFRNFLDRSDQKNPAYQEQVLEVYNTIIAPLVERAKKTVTSNLKHLSSQAAAEKGRALQAGLKTITDLEKGAILPKESKKIKEEKVSVIPATGAVLKKGNAQSTEEEHQIDALISLSIKKGNVPFFSFADLSSKRFGSPTSAGNSKPARAHAGSPAGAAGPHVALAENSNDSAKAAAVTESPAKAPEKPPAQQQNADAKPYIEGLMTFNDLLKNEALSRRVLERLDQNSEIKAVLTAEFQFLDLHAGNLGVVPILAQEHEHFRDLSFAYGLKTGVPFHSLVEEFLSGNINENTKIFFSSKDKQTKAAAFQPIKAIPGLLKALNSPWEFVLFDMDRALAESNELQIQRRQGVLESSIPFRSVLLGFSWKSNPLSRETIETLQDPSRDERVRNWVSRKDAPVRKWMRHPEQIDRLLKKEIEQEKYTLSAHRIQGKEMTVEELRKTFSEDLSSLDNYPEIWNAIQQELSADRSTGWFKPYRVRQDETLAEIAQKHHLSTDELMALNRQHTPDSIIRPGTKLRVKDDLTSQSPSAERQRKKIAAQFFPRLSWKQRDALFERQVRRNEYLQNVQRLASIKEYSPNVLNDVKTIILSHSTPLSTNLKNEFLHQIDELMNVNERKEGLNEFTALMKELNEQFTPSYFNLVKAMYPLLADVHELLFYLSKHNAQTAGLNIGLYSRPLEEVINESKEERPFSLTTSMLENRMQELKNGPAAFFGEWSEEMEESKEVTETGEKGESPQPSVEFPKP